ncbi:MAG: rRNA maturation RNase YbeY [Cyclobacteriaceae bacterium]
MPEINFFNEGIDFEVPSKRDVQKWIKIVVQQERKSLNELNYIFCTDDYLLKMNQQYLNHNTYTDIITFDNSENDLNLSGDIYISVDRVKENASSFSVPFNTELNRVMIHGVLHLLGYADKTDLDKKVMREKEDACLSLLK